MATTGPLSLGDALPSLWGCVPDILTSVSQTAKPVFDLDQARRIRTSIRIGTGRIAQSQHLFNHTGRSMRRTRAISALTLRFNCFNRG
jgi:hypothetical protein